MKNTITSLLLCILFTLPALAQKKTKTKVQRHDTLITLSTQFGDIKMLLYEDTPKHRSNFLKLVREKFYNNLLFHRVIKDFMIQGGDPNSKNAKPDQMLGAGGLPYTVEAEFRANRFHKKGALAAARTENPTRASSSCQFYIVHGKKYEDAELSNIAKSRQLTLTPAQVDAYKKIGGTPFLDQNYTVFGEVVEGLDVLDKIATQPTARGDRPQKDIQMSFSFKKMKKKDITAKYGFVYPEIK